MLNGHLPILPVPEKLGKELETTLTLFEREKELYYMGLLLLAKGFTTNQPDNVIIAPLLLYPAVLESREDDHFVRPDISQPSFNVQVLRHVATEMGLPTMDYVAQMQQEQPNLHWDLGEVGKLARLLQRWLPGIDVESLFNYPELFGERKIKSLYRDLKEKEVMVIPASLLGVTAKSDNIRSVLNDLGELCGSPLYSGALQALFYPDTVSTANGSEFETGHLPVLLNASQEQAILAANQYAISQITGPPGTGKSYTIAAMAAELASKGQTVLIASRTDAAVDVIHEKIEHDLKLKDVAIRGGKRGYNRKLYHRVNGLLSGKHKTVLSIGEALNNKADLKQKLDVVNGRIKTLEDAFAQKVANELEWGTHLGSPHRQKKFGAKIKNAYISLRNNWQHSLGLTVTQLNALYGERMALGAQYVKLCFNLRIAQGLNSHRELFNRFAQALGNQSATANEQQLEQLDANTLLGVFPIWLVNTSHLRKVLPMKHEMFDVAIIDEATQCDVASFLPVLQRAKRVVVAGDPQQLRHVSFLSYSQQKALMDKHRLGQQWQAVCNYRDTSLLDVATAALRNGAQVSFLNEHYRSRPPIIQFSNHHFYDRQLNIMTERPGHEQHPALFVHKCDGIRDAKGCNTAEAEVAIALLKELVARGEQERTIRSIGIISPFRKQADYLADSIAQAFDSKTIAQHKMMVGTAYQFQGSERDIMLLSLAVDHNTHHSAFVHINKPDVFNVSITRARAELHIFQSIEPSNMAQDSLLRRYLEYVDDPVHHLGEYHDNELDHFQEQVVQLLQTKWPQADIHKGITIAGLLIDIVLMHKGKVYGIDLIGYPGEYQEAFSLERYRMYRRAGIHLFPLAYSNWLFRSKECLGEMREFFA